MSCGASSVQTKLMQNQPISLHWTACARADQSKRKYVIRGSGTIANYLYLNYSAARSTSTRAPWHRGSNSSATSEPRCPGDVMRAIQSTTTRSYSHYGSREVRSGYTKAPVLKRAALIAAVKVAADSAAGPCPRSAADLQLGPDNLFAPMRDRAKVLRVPHYDRNDSPPWLLILIIPNRERATAAATHSSEGAAATAPENPREIPGLPP
jgi:hypothetical protein